MSQRALAEDVALSLATVSNFLRGRPVDRATFIELCDRLSLDADSISEVELGINDIEIDNSSPVLLPSPPAVSPAFVQRQSWGEAIDVTTFYGRAADLATLRHWIKVDRCRLITLVGMGGIGKTTLSVKLAEQVQDDFQFVIWRSLRNAPLVEELLADLIGFLSQQQVVVAGSLDGRLNQFLALLRDTRCLVVLDNAESILSSDRRAGSYRSGYEGYSQVLKGVGETRHQSCLLLTSREKVRELNAREGVALPIRSLRLKGLEQGAAQEIIREKGFAVSDVEEKALIEAYAGNPLALKIAATTIQELFDGNTAEFLAQNTINFGDISELLDQQFNRLSALEKQVMIWLAIDREWTTLAELQQDMLPTVTARSAAGGNALRSLLEALESLQLRSLIEKTTPAEHQPKPVCFTQQPVVMEYVTQRLIDQVCEEIRNRTVAVFDHYALIKAQAKDYLRTTQVRLILKPIAEQLSAELGGLESVTHCLEQMLSILRSRPARQAGYAGGNLLNLLGHLGVKLNQLDFSHLAVWQAYLRGVSLQGVNFAGADLSQSVFTQTLGSLLSAAFSPDGTLLATGIDSEVCLWQVDESRQLLTCRGHIAWVQCIAFSPDGRLLASGSHDQTIRLWNVETGQCVKTLRGHTATVESIAFSADGQWLASGSHDHSIRLWDGQTWECLNVLKAHTRRVLSVEFGSAEKFGSAEPILVSSSDDGTVRVWDVEAGKCLQTIETNVNWVRSIALSPKGKLLVTGSDATAVQFWDWERGTCVKTLSYDSSQVWAVAFSPDGNLLATASEDRTVKIWSVETGNCLQTYQDHRERVWFVAFSALGQLVSISDDQTMKLWDVQTGRCLSTLNGYSNWVASIAFSADGMTIASGSEDNQIRLWNVETGECDKVLKGHTNLISSIAFFPEIANPVDSLIPPLSSQRLVSGSDDQTIKLWDGVTGECLQTFWGHGDWVQSVSISPDGKLLASASRDQTVRIWDALTGECLHLLRGHGDRVKSVAFDSTGMMLISGSNDGTVKLWQVRTGDCVQTFEGHEDWVLSVAFSPVGRWFASGSADGSIKLWDGKTGDCVRSLQGHTHRIRSIAFSLDGKMLASGGDDQTVRLWDVQTGNCVEVLLGHTHTVWSVAFSPQAARVASGSGDQTIRLWDIASGNCVKQMRLDRPYEGMNIEGVVGLTAAQRMTLKALGARE
ncbi:NB-ARC domain-containing protein [Leptolyngbya ohadii]|uniref:WD40 domain-containing protein n=1 Tax=Leptolyngbya ohadii TaxID=1962290 RepID=UPI0019D45DDA|nr:NB-ARC domain-containing protein [Leptolyngbya ohadii]